MFKKLFSPSHRKLKVSLLSMFLITVGYVFTGFFSELNESYFTFVMGILAAAGIHHGANVTNKNVLGKHGILKPDEELP